MFHCPSCRSVLLRTRTAGEAHWSCSHCGVRTSTVGDLRRALGAERVDPVWEAALKAPRSGDRSCGLCSQPLRTVSGSDGARSLEVCVSCQVVWFGAGEYERFRGPVPTPPAPRELPLEFRQTLAKVELLKLDRQAAREAAEEASAPPEELWKVIPAALGFPVEGTARTLGRTPLVTWLLAALMALVTAAVLLGPAGWIDRFGWIPAETGRFGGVTLVTSFFTHASLLHLLGNAYFLLVFGDDVEDRLGPGRYLLLIALAELAGDALHMAIEPDPTLPLVGASAGISGIMAFYMVRFPKARLKLFLVFLALGRGSGGWVSFPAILLLPVWIGYQVVLLRLQSAGVSQVSAAAHLGGAAAGLLVALLLGRGDRSTGP